MEKIKKGLKDECKKKTYIDDDKVNEEKIAEFLKKAYFVIDDQSKSQYVKKIIKLNPAIIPDEDTLIAIFNQCLVPFQEAAVCRCPKFRVQTYLPAAVFPRT